MATFASSRWKQLRQSVTPCKACLNDWLGLLSYGLVFPAVDQVRLEGVVHDVVEHCTDQVPLPRAEEDVLKLHDRA